MTITSTPFGGTTLTGDDATAFERQVAEGPGEARQRLIAEAIERGRKMVADLERAGSVVVSIQSDTIIANNP